MWISLIWITLGVAYFFIPTTSVATEIDVEYNTTVEEVEDIVYESSSKVRDVKLKGVNTSKLGDSIIELEYRDSSNRLLHRELTMHVVDTIPPTIIVEDKVSIDIDDINKNKFVERIKITDNHTAGIVPNVSSISTKTTKPQDITITATDSVGNESNVVVSVTVTDKQKPTITVSNSVIGVGSKFDLLDGVAVSDNSGHNLMGKLSTSGEVDVSTAGDYTIEYSVSDYHGNETKAARVVSVVWDVPITPVTQAMESVVSSVESDSSELPNATEVVDEPAPAARAISPMYEPMTINMLGATLYYQNGGMGSGQAIIDSGYIASTWGGASVQSGGDGMNSHIIGHNPGVFAIMFSATIGTNIVVTDAVGTPTTYVVSSVYQTDDLGITSSGQYFYDDITGTGGGERVTFQACANDDINLIVVAVAH